MSFEDITADDIKWIVTESGDLGVLIGGKVFTMYKGHSLLCQPLSYREIGKREFDESVKPLALTRRCNEDMIQIGNYRNHDECARWDGPSNPWIECLITRL